MADPTAQSASAPVPPPAIQPSPLQAIEVHLKNLDAPANAAPEKRSKLDMVNTLVTIANTVLLFIFGTVINGHLEEALKERELHSENVRQMQQLVLDLVNPNSTREAAHASAIALAAYGRDALPMLLQIVRADSTYGGEAAADGLRAVEPSEAGGVCSGLAATLVNRTRLYSFPAHRRALQLMMQLECRSQLPVLHDYQVRLERALKASGEAEQQRLYPFRAIATGAQPGISDAQDVMNQLMETVASLQNQQS